MNGTLEARGGPTHIPPQLLRQEQEEEDRPAEDRRNPRGLCRTPCHSACVDHPPTLHRRRKYSDDNDKGRHNYSHRSQRSSHTSVKLRLGSDHERDRSPRRGHSHGGERDGRRRPVVLGEPAPSYGTMRVGPICFGLSKQSPEQVKARNDRALQDLFASYVKSLHEALHEVLDQTQP